ncbi:MAG: NTP/NDP exchange transporter [Chlamydiales bacterium]|nr:NTP/NDP exchange transporter [Chlamydiales bacterium]NCF71701.1 NTP/NDP exchange transporter [Chlamydiales bacterium]
MEDQAQHKPFGTLRGYLWPIRRHELAKVLPLMTIFFLVSLIYNLLRCLKDSLVVPSTGAGASIIPFLKLWMMFPGAILLTFIYTRVANRFSIEKVFYIMIGGFLLFFFAFTFIYFPNHQSMHLDALGNYLETVLPSGWLGLAAMVRYWGFSLFYVMSELWGSIVLFLLVWGFINQVTQFEQAKRIYAFFGLVMNIGSVLAGQTSSWVSQMSIAQAAQNTSGGNWNSLIIITSIILVSGVLALAIFYWLTHYLFKDVRYQKIRQESKKVKMSLKDSLKYILNSKYLMYLAVIVVAYNAIINLCEVTWKEQANLLYPHKNEYLAFMGGVTTKVGIVSTLMSLCILGNTFRFGSWTFTAMITPVILLLTTLAFFGTLIFTDGAMLSSIVLLGTIQNVLSRSSKYTVYDATKEVAFTPLSDESKLKGKASLDGIGSRFGKSGGAGINMLLMGLFGSLANSVSYIAVIIVAMCLCWMYAVSRLGKQLSSHIKDDVEKKNYENNQDAVEKHSSKDSSLKRAL